MLRKRSGELSAQFLGTASGSLLNSNMVKISSPTETWQFTESLIAVFQKCAAEGQNNDKLPNRKFRNFINAELAFFAKNQKYLGVFDHMMKKLDLNYDGQLKFQTFLNLIKCHSCGLV